MVRLPQFGEHGQRFKRQLPASHEIQPIMVLTQLNYLVVPLRSFILQVLMFTLFVELIDTISFFQIEMYCCRYIARRACYNK